jgi:NAD+ kinase
MRTVGIAANSTKPEARQRLSELLRVLAERQVAPLLETEAAMLAGRSKEARPLSEIGQQAEMIFVLGGDGTILRVARELEGAPTPLLGINLGSLGFLASVRSEDLTAATKQILQGEFEVSERFTIQTTVLRAGQPVAVHPALNDAVISRGAFSRIVRLRVAIDGELLTEYVCDGMIFATPTGSTAYSLSAGGPILLPSARACIVTPICPHALSNRSVIAGEDSVVTCEVKGAAGDLLLTVDGQVQVRIQVGDEVEVRRAPHPVRLAMLKGQTYFDVLRQKLKWSGSNV